MRGTGPRPSLSEFERLRRQLRRALVALLLVILVGVTGFSVIGAPEHGVVDAVYMTVITLTTVGYGEIIEMSHRPEGRVFTALLLLVGISIFAYSLPLLTAFVVEGQLTHIFERGRMQKQLSRLDGHHVVCGETAAALYVAEELAGTARPVALVVPDEDSRELARQRLGQIPMLAGDPTDDSVLLAAGIERAQGVVFCTGSEKDNILGVLAARRLAPGVRIVAATERPETEDKLRAAGADAVVSPSRIGGLRIASELVRPGVVSFLDQMLRGKHGGLRVEEVAVAQDSPCAGQTLSELGIGALEGILLLAVRDPRTGEYEFKPPAERLLEPGTTLVVMAAPEARQRLERRIAG